MAKISLASRVRAGVWTGKDLAGHAAGVDHIDHVLEHVAFGDDHGTAVHFEGVSCVGVPVIVNGMQQRVAADFGRTSGGVVDIVVLESY